MALEHWTAERIEQEIELTRFHIRAALWGVTGVVPVPGTADIELARVLISKKKGLEICLGMRSAPKLVPPAIAMKRQGLDARGLLAA